MIKSAWLSYGLLQCSFGSVSAIAQTLPSGPLSSQHRTLTANNDDRPTVHKSERGASRVCVTLRQFSVGLGRPGNDRPDGILIPALAKDGEVPLRASSVANRVRPRAHDGRVLPPRDVAVAG